MRIQKKELRQKMARTRQDAFDSTDIGPAEKNLRGFLEESAFPVSFYWPIRTEIDPRRVMEEMSARGQVCLPMTHGFSALTFRPWAPGTAMTEDSFGVAVPVTEVTVVPKTLVLPLLAFDERGHRLGYGAGHYDRTLESLRLNSDVTAVGFAFEAQRTENLPIEPTDQPLDAIVTEKSVRRIPSKESRT